MATKKEKRAAAMIKREKILENVRLTGLMALKKDKDSRNNMTED